MPLRSKGQAPSPATVNGRSFPTFDHSTQSGEIDTLRSVAARSSNDQWAVGSWSKYPEDYHFHPLVEHWDGSAAGWTAVANPTFTVDTALYGVTALASDNAWAVGGSVFEPNESVVEHWDGTSWSNIPSGSFPGILYAVTALGPNNIWAVGTRSYPGPMLIEHWDGTSWTASYQLAAGRFGGNLRGITALGPRTCRQPCPLKCIVSVYSTRPAPQ